jgi:hypothetical protein
LDDRDTRAESRLLPYLPVPTISLTFSDGGFSLPPPAVLFLPVAVFLLHQPALRYPARLSFEVLVSTRVAHGACIYFLARRLQCLSDRSIPQGGGKLNVTAFFYRRSSSSSGTGERPWASSSRSHRTPCSRISSSARVGVGTLLTHATVARARSWIT